jgi:hypothetical protein
MTHGHPLQWLRIALSAAFLVVAIVRLWVYMRGRR